MGALAFSKSRRRLFTIFAGIVSALALLQLIGLKALRPELLNEIEKATYKPAVATVYDALTLSFRHSVLVMFFVGVVLLIIGIFSNIRPQASLPVVNAIGIASRRLQH